LWIKYILLNIHNERVQSIERVFILYSGQRTFKKKSFLFTYRKKKKKTLHTLIYSELFIQWIKCRYRWWEFFFFFFFSLLIWKNNLRTLRSCFIHQWLRSFIFVKLTERKKNWTSFFLFFTVQTLTTNQNCLSLPINCPFYHIQIIKKAN